MVAYREKQELKRIDNKKFGYITYTDIHVYKSDVSPSGTLLYQPKYPTYSIQINKFKCLFAISVNDSIFTFFIVNNNSVDYLSPTITQISAVKLYPS